MKHTLISITIVILAAGCTATRPLPRDTDAIAKLEPVERILDGEPLDGVVPARVIEIDGVRTSQGPHGHTVEPGTHSIRVWPHRLDPRSVHNGEAIAMAARFDATEGDRYGFMARTYRYRSAAFSGRGTLIAEAPWKTVVLPVIVYTKSAPR